MKHKIEFKKRCETLQETISFLLKNNFHFSIYSHQYIDDEYFNFSNTLQLWKENNDNLLSAIGHESTAQIMTELLETEVSVNRIQFEQESNQKAIVFKLNGRAPEGVILSKEEIAAIGYKFQLLEKID